MYLSHHGIIGQKWGIRRFQNKDGTLTAAGKQRRNSEEGSSEKNSSSNSDYGPTGKRTTARSLSEMSDDDLNNDINRLRKEREYEQLTDYRSRDLKLAADSRELEKKYSDITNDPAYVALENKVKMMRLEKEYKGFLAEQEKAMHPAREFVKDVLRESGKQVAKEFVTNTMKDFVNKKWAKPKVKGESP